MSEPGWRLSLITVLVQPGCADGDVVLDGSGLTADEYAVSASVCGAVGHAIRLSLVSSTPLFQQSLPLPFPYSADEQY